MPTITILCMVATAKLTIDTVSMTGILQTLQNRHVPANSLLIFCRICFWINYGCVYNKEKEEEKIKATTEPWGIAQRKKSFVKKNSG